MRTVFTSLVSLERCTNLTVPLKHFHCTLPHIAQHIVRLFVPFYSILFCSALFGSLMLRYVRNSISLQVHLFTYKAISFCSSVVNIIAVRLFLYEMATKQQTNVNNSNDVQTGRIERTIVRLACFVVGRWFFFLLFHFAVVPSSISPFYTPHRSLRLQHNIIKYK